MIDLIRRSALDNWQELWPDAPSPKHVRTILQSRRRVILFLFDVQDRGRRFAVAKVSRRVEENAQLERAVRLVSAVRQRLGEDLTITVPKTILLDPIHGLSASLEQGLAGTPMFLGHMPLSGLRHHRRNWQTWQDWLVEFQRQTVIDSVAIDVGMIGETIEPEFARALKDDPVGLQVGGDLQEIAHRLDGSVIHRVWRYGDAHPSNILTRGSRVSGVVDWEGGEEDSWPTSDWFQFAFQYLVGYYRVRSLNASESDLAIRALDAILRPATSPLASMVREMTVGFLASLGMGEPMIPACFVVFLAHLYWPSDKRCLLRHAHTILCG